MQNHLEQAKHNYNFILYLEKNCKNMFGDWKITVVFYCSLHLLRAYATNKTGKSYKSHFEFSKDINPLNQNATCPVPKEIYDTYADLETTSKRARYTGIVFGGNNHIKVWETDFIDCRNNLKTIKKFLTKNGIQLGF